MSFKILDEIALVQVNITVLFSLEPEMQGKFARAISCCCTLIAKSLQTWILEDNAVTKVEHDTTEHLVGDFGG